MDREIFAAQYFKQRVAYSPEHPSNRYILNAARLQEYSQNADFVLALKSVKQLTEEEANEVSAILWKGLPIISRYYGVVSKIGVAHIVEALEQGKPGISPTNWAETKEFLRTKGYAVSWNGISVEQQIELGWILLETN